MRSVKNKPTQPNPGLVQQINAWEAFTPYSTKIPSYNIPLSGCVLQDTLYPSTAGSTLFSFSKTAASSWQWQAREKGKFQLWLGLI